MHMCLATPQNAFYRQFEKRALLCFVVFNDDMVGLSGWSVWKSQERHIIGVQVAKIFLADPKTKNVPPTETPSAVGGGYVYHRIAGSRHVATDMSIHVSTHISWMQLEEQSRLQQMPTIDPRAWAQVRTCVNTHVLYTCLLTCFFT